MSWQESASTRDTSMQSSAGWPRQSLPYGGSGALLARNETGSKTGIGSNTTDSEPGTVRQGLEARMDAKPKRKLLTWVRRAIRWILASDERDAAKEQRRRADEAEAEYHRSRRRDNGK